MSKARDVADSYTDVEVDAKDATLQTQVNDRYTKAEVDAKDATLQTQVNTKLTKRNITYISPSQHNNMIMVMDGKVYTASGNSGSNGNAGTGRGLDNQISTFGLDNFKQIHFDGLPNTANVVKVGGTGYDLNFALFDNRYLYTWGYNNKGVCGLGHTSPVGTPTLAATDCTDVYDSYISDGWKVDESSFFIKKADGYVYAAGDGNDGQFGLRNLNDSPTFVKLTWIGTNPKFVCCNSGYAGSVIVQKSDGTIWAAGNGDGGSMFTGVNHSGQSTPIEITNNVGGLSAGDVVYSVKSYRYYDTDAKGSSHGLLMRRTDAGVTSVYTAGYNAWGQRGDGTTTSSVTPYLVPNMSDVADIVSTGGNPATILALKSNGDLYAWGHSGGGKSGLGTTNVLSPTLVMSGVSKLLTRELDSHRYGYNVQVFVRRTDDKVYCWGYSDATGYLGTGESSRITTPTLNKTLTSCGSPIKMIGSFTTSGHGRVFCAVTEDNRIYGWGYSGYQGLTADSTIHQKIPIQFNLPQENN
jgi:alpha-tubulin suppressor-like RCC1 family protein